MASKADQVTELLKQSEEVDALAAEVQARPAAKDTHVPDELIQDVRRRYHQWYGKCLALIQPDLKQRFVIQYEAFRPSNIKEFLREMAVVRENRQRTGYTSHYRETYIIRGYFGSAKYEAAFKMRLIEQQMILMQAEARYREEEAAEVANPVERRPNLGALQLHPRVLAVAGKLYADGHYREAVFKACLLVNLEVQKKSGSAKDGAQLMQDVFSPKNPTLRVSEHQDEREGVMYLFKGLWMGVRNARGHKLGEGEDLDAAESLEWLAFVSALMRLVDQSENVQDAPVGLVV